VADREATCEERIAANLAGRLEDFAAYVAVGQDGGTKKQRDAIDIEGKGEEARENALEGWSEYPLGVEVKKVLRVDLSTGGPADWFEVILDTDGQPETIMYVFQDWFDGARRSLSGDEFAAAWAFLSYFSDAEVVLDRRYDLIE